MLESRGVHRDATALALAASLLISCASVTPTPPASPAASASATRAAVVLHWMSFSSHSEPRYRLLYEGGEGTPFTELRLVAPDGTVTASGPATPSASEVMRLCSRSGTTTYGPIRVTLILPTQQALGDVIQRPDAYRVEAMVNSVWVGVQLILECHGQE